MVPSHQVISPELLYNAPAFATVALGAVSTFSIQKAPSPVSATFKATGNPVPK